MTLTAESTTTATDSANAPSRYLVLFALEEIAGSFRQATFDVLTSILGERGFTVTPVHISRFCLRSTTEEYLEDLLCELKADRLSVDMLMEDVKNGIAMQLSSQATSLPAHIASLVDAAGGTGIPLAAVTALPRATAETLMDTLKLNDRGVQLLVDGSDDEHFPRVDNWLKVAKQLHKSPMNCGVICTGQTAAKSAVAAGMRCVALPDQFTGFEDFSGVNAIYDDTEALDAVEALGVLCPHLALA